MNQSILEAQPERLSGVTDLAGYPEKLLKQNGILRLAWADEIFGKNDQDKGFLATSLYETEASLARASSSPEDLAFVLSEWAGKMLFYQSFESEAYHWDAQFGIRLLADELGISLPTERLTVRPLQKLAPERLMELASNLLHRLDDAHVSLVEKISPREFTIALTERPQLTEEIVFDDNAAPQALAPSAGLEEIGWEEARSRLTSARKELPNEATVKILVDSLRYDGPYGRRNRKVAVPVLREWIRRGPEGVSPLSPKAGEITDALLDIIKEGGARAVLLPYSALKLLESLSSYKSFRQVLEARPARLDRSLRSLTSVSDAFRERVERMDLKNLQDIRQLPHVSPTRFYANLQEAVTLFRPRVLTGIGPEESKRQEKLLRVLGRVMPSDVKSRIFIISSDAALTKDLSGLGFVAGNEPLAVLRELNQEFPDLAKILLNYHASSDEEAALREAAELFGLKDRFDVVRQQADPNPFSFLQAILANLMGIPFDAVLNYVNTQQLDEDLQYLLNV